MADCNFESAEWFKKELGLAFGGATVFIIVSKVSLVLNLLHKKSWYTDLMTFLVALSMGTMYCITLAQFIPEAFGLHTEYKYKTKNPCAIVKPGEYFDLFKKMPSFMKTDCQEKCESIEPECSLIIGGPKVYIWLAMVAYIATIVFYSSEHVINFINWTRTSRTSEESDENVCSLDEIKEDNRKTNRARTMHIAAQTSGIPPSNIVQSYSQCIKRTNSIQVYSTVDELKRQSGPAIPPRKKNLELATYKGGNVVIESDTNSISEPMIPNENHDESHEESHDHHGKQDWSKVQTHAWTLLLTIAIKSFIEGIAFVLTLQDSFSAGLAFLVAMIFKLFPLEPGYAIILSAAGLNHFWENLLSTLAVLPIYLGTILGIILEDQFNAVKGYIFAALSGIFLYLSLATLFPVLRNLMSESTLLASTGFRKRGLLRLMLALMGFLLAMGIIIPLVYFKNDMKYQFKTSKFSCMNSAEYNN